MEQTELISVITPAYNVEEYISQAIESVIAQTYPYWEMLIVDDGSKDNTAAVVKQYAAKDSRIKYLYQKNGKQGKARNTGISKAAGKYIAFLDADDVWIRNKLELQLSCITQDNIDLVFSNAYIFSDEFTEEKRMHVLPGLYSGAEGLQEFLMGNKIPILTVLTTKEAIDACGGFSETSNIQNAEDYHLWLKMLIMGKTFVSMNNTLAYYRLHSNAVTFNDKEAILPVLHVFINLAENHPQLKPVFFDMVTVRINSYLINNIITDYKQLSQLLAIRNTFSTYKINLHFWNSVYCVVNYRIFRKMFLLLNKTFLR